MKILIPHEGDASFELLDLEKEESIKKFLNDFIPYLPSAVKDPAIVTMTSDASMYGREYNNSEGRGEVFVYPYPRPLAGASTVPFFISPEGKVLVALVHNVLKDGDKKIYRLPEGYFNPKRPADGSFNRMVIIPSEVRDEAERNILKGLNDLKNQQEKDKPQAAFELVQKAYKEALQNYEKKYPHLTNVSVKNIPDKDLQDTAERELQEEVFGRAKRIFKVCSEMNMESATFIETYAMEIENFTSLQANGIEISKISWVDPTAFEFRSDDSAEKFSVYITDYKIPYKYALRIARLMQMVYNEQIKQNSLINGVSLFSNRDNALASLYLRPLVTAIMQKNNEIDHNIFKSISQQFSEKTNIVAEQLPGRSDDEKKLDLESLFYLTLDAFNDHKQIKKIIENHKEIAKNLKVTIVLEKEKENNFQFISVATNKSSFYANNSSISECEKLDNPQNEIRFSFQS